MKLLQSEEHKFFALQAKSVGTPYRDILTFTERVADELENDFAFERYNEVFFELEKKHDIKLSMGDVGEVFVLLASYWKYGERLLEHLSFIESKIIAENVEFRLSVLAREGRG